MKNPVVHAIYQHRILAILRGFEPAVCVKLGEAYERGGIRLVEVPFPQDRPADFEKTRIAIQALREQLPERLYVGCGTVITRQQLQLAYDAHAHFVVTPTVDPQLIQEAHELGLVTLAGAMTPTEALTAFHAGADFVKLFPAGPLGPEYLRALRAPLAQIPFLAFGGITHDNLIDFLDAGAVGVGIGAPLAPPKLIRASNWNAITEIARTFTDSIRDHAITTRVHLQP